MNQLTARPRLLKQANLSLIRKAVKAKGTATKAEIVEETQISATTVRSLLTEMVEKGELESLGLDESSGGRKAERYGFAANRYYGAAFCMSDNQLHALLVNMCGEIVETTKIEIIDENYEQEIILFMEKIRDEREIKAIGLGVPGIVEGSSFWKKQQDSDELYKTDMGDTLTKRYGIPVVLENDLNAITIGFGKCYKKAFANVRPECTNMAYLYFEKQCISAGFIAGGRIIRGYNNFAGELGLIPAKGEKRLDACMLEPMDNMQYTRLVTQILSWICGILNPQYIALGGPELRTDCISSIGDLLSSLLPKQMEAEILYSADSWYDYYSGMAFLTAGKMFEEVQFIKE